MSKIFDNSSDQAVDLSNLGTIIRERREALGLTQSRLAQLSGLSRQTLVGLVAALGDGTLGLGAGCDWEQARHDLLRLPGIGPWTAEIIAMRGLGDPDAFPVADLGVQLAARQLGLPDGTRALTDRSTRWRPWRSYATQHLWTALDHDVNDWPPTSEESA